MKAKKRTNTATADPPQAVSGSQGKATLGQATRDALRQCFRVVSDILRTSKLGKAIPDKAIDEVLRALPTLVLDSATRKAARRPRRVLIEMPEYEATPWRPVLEFLARPEVKLVQVVRLLYLTGQIDPEQEYDAFFLREQADDLLSAFRKTHPFGLPELAAVMEAVGLDGNRLGLHRLAGGDWSRTPFATWEPEAIWPYFAERLDQIDRALQATGFDAKDQRRAALGVLALFPQPPAKYLPKLWAMAVGTKTDRALAQPCLERVPDRTQKLVAALQCGKAPVRAAAAEWLGRLRELAAVEPLLDALRSEKQEAVRDAFMHALEQLGVPAERFLDRTGLHEAAQAAAKLWPKELQWLSLGELPRAHWADSGQALDPAIVQWWLFNAWKSKSPEPGTLLQRYCFALRQSERGALGQFILEAWIAEDLTPITRLEAEKEARAHAREMVQWARMMPSPSGSAKPKTEAEYYIQYLPQFLKQPRGSATASKGVLALAAACAGAGAAPVIGRYLKEWYGMRAAQCRALLQALAWVDHPNAAQLLFAVGRRFRTRTIQEEANKQVQALAERKGWSVLELADRTVPTAGLDEDGVLLLNYGPRQFRAQLNDALELSLFDESSKPIRTLPEPRQDDDAAKAAEARRQFGVAKKELKSLLGLQRERLYEAMCTQRAWRFEDWELYLHEHPLLRYYCQRLVWAAFREDKLAGTFRALPDKSLTGPADTPFDPLPDDRVRVAHECLVTPEVSRGWRQHLVDYKAEPLFEQFGRPTFELSAERRQEGELSDFRGHLLEALKLRARSTKLGYTRGQAQDGGWYCDYHKRFPTLGMESILEFTGNDFTLVNVPEANRTVALTVLRFQRLPPSGQPGPTRLRMSLGEVPPVLLSECWNDLRQIAAEGPGFDPDWEKKTQI